jgi:hypothetical protein
MSNTVQDYLNLITSEYQNQPKFNATVAFMVAVPVQVQTLLEEMMTTLFDLDTPPVGDQLDIIGAWVGASRQVNIPISGVYFTWDAPSAEGWDFGTWQSSPPTSSVTVLPDSQYLTLILAKIAANNWDGTTEGAYTIWDALFPQFTILILDQCNMSYDLAVIGGIVDSLTLALITGGYIPLRPEGVLVNNYLVSVDTNPAFSWDVDTADMKGWDQSSWLKIVAPT